VLNPILAKIGWRPASGESPRVGLLRLSLISALGRFNDRAVVAEAQRRFLGADTDPQAMPGDIRSAVQSVALSHADQALLDEALRRAKSAKSQMERNELFSAMAGVRDPALAKKMLDLAISDTVSVTIGPRLIQRISGNHEVLAWQFSLDHLDRIAKGLDSMASAQFMPSLLSGTQDGAMAQTLADYIDKSVRPEDRARANAALASARQNVRFKSEQRGRVDSWLRKKGF
jgi:aminopeptidase N